MEIIFDTYAFIKKMKDAGMPEQQAVVMSDTIKQVEQSRADVLATKSDLLQVKTELKADIMLLKWMLGFVLALNASIALKIFFMH